MPIKTDSYGLLQAFYALIILEIQILAVGIDFSIVALLVHPIETAFRTNDVGFAAITAIPAGIGLIVAPYPGGLLADTFRRRDVIALGAVIWTLGAIVAARADSGAMLFVARLLAGIGTGVVIPASASMLSDAFPQTRRALAVGAYYAGISIGNGVGLTICGALVEAAQRNGMFHINSMLLSPWQQCFVAVAAIGILVLLLILTVPEPARRERSAAIDSNVISSLRIFGHYLRRHGLLWAVMFIGGSIGFTSYAGVLSWAPAFGLRQYGAMGVSSTALLGAFIAGGSLLGSIGGGLLVQRGINRGDFRIVPRMFVVALIITCAVGAGYPYMPSWLFAVIGIGAVCTTWSAMAALMMVGIQETASSEFRGQLFGLWGFLVNIPYTISAPVIAFLATDVFAKAGGLGPALAITDGATSAVAVLLFLFAGAPYERAKHDMHGEV